MNYLKKYENLGFFLANVIPLLIIAQFDQNFLNFRYALLIIPLLSLIFIIKNYYYKSRLIYILLIYTGSHFAFLSNFGGTFSLVTLLVIIFYITNNRKLVEFSFKDTQIAIVFFILIVFTVFGWILKSKLSSRDLLFSIVTFFSFIIMFYISSRIYWNELRIKLFLIVICCLAIYAFFSSIINTFNIIPLNSTLWASYEVDLTSDETFFYSMLYRPSTAVGAMYFGFLFPFYLQRRKQLFDKKTNRILLGGIIASALVCILGFSKSHSIVLLIISILVPVLLFRVDKFKSAIFRKYFQFASLGVLIFIMTEPIFHYETLIRRFEKQPELFQSFINNPFLPEGTSREESFSLGLASLKRENWIIGYGYSNGILNRIAWLGEENTDLMKKDFHNLFYSLPQLFGWLGAIAYISIFLITLKRMFKIYFSKKTILYYRLLSFSFFILLLTHLMTEFSITSLTTPYYVMMIFIILGLANSVYYNYKKGLFLIPQS